MSPSVFNVIYEWSNERGEDGDGKRGVRMGESGDCRASCMQMTWFYVVSQRRT